MLDLSERCPSCWLPSRALVSRRVDYGWPVVLRNGSSTDGPGRRCRLCRRQSRFHGLQIVEDIVEVFDIQTSESLDTASVRRVTPAEFIEVIEIAAPLPAELESPMFVTASARVQQDRSCRQRDCVPAWAPRHKRSVQFEFSTARRHRWNATRLEASCCCVTEFSGGGQGCLETRKHSAVRHCDGFPLICHKKTPTTRRCGCLL